MVRENLKWVPFTQLGNLTGAPAMSVPLHWTADGLPLGTHFVAPHGGEGVLFGLAGQLERAQPWKDRRPPL
jgi:amidase